MILSDFISPDLMVARSINLERDMGVETALEHYHLTGKGLEILNRLAAALNGERINAWSLTGPYGMGKSSFANYLLALCGPKDEKETIKAWEMLANKHERLANDLSSLLNKRSSGRKGLFRVAVTSSFESINRTLANGLRRSLMDINHQQRKSGNELAALLRKTESLCATSSPETPQLVELFKAAGILHGAPIALVIDEFGKNLEYMARFPAQGDLFILQALAESHDVFIWVCLHQAFEEYTSRLTARQLQEWGKIQGRFEDISFVESKSEMINFIGETLARKNNDPAMKKAVRSWAEYYHSEAGRLELTELRDLDITTIERLFPLHPLTAVVLPELCMRFAQNDRTLFAFLCSGEPNALPTFLSSETIDLNSGGLPTFGLQKLYDYFLTSSSAALMNRPESQRWIEIQDIIERSRNVDSFHLDVLKAIGLLNLISGPSRFRSSDKLVSFAFAIPNSINRASSPELHKVIKDNIDKGVLIYREYADEYRLWEGTDFDIPAAVRERKASLATQALEEVLREALPLSPLIASKHSYESGTLRYFERFWCSYSQPAEEVIKCSSDEVDGLILYCFGKQQDPPLFPTKMPDGRPVVLCYAACEEQIRDLVLDSAATKAVLREAPELINDGVARKEAKFRAQVAEERLRDYLYSLFAPGNKEATWHALGEQQKLRSHRDLSRLLSECCDSTYSNCPTIRNELINRSRLSSAASRARRELMQAMVLNETHEDLGLQGNGPEVAIYRTMILSEGLHRPGDDGTWNFCPPEPNTHYYPVWQALTDAMENAGEANVPVMDLIGLLRSPPFGLKEGPIPILLCLLLLVNSDEIALYQEGSFVPFLGPEEIELLTKRPEYFMLKRFRKERLRGQVFQLYMSLLKTQAGNDKGQLRNATMIGVVGPLVQFVKALKPYALNTRAVSRHARNVRQVLQQARDPFDLLFKDLPEALDLPPFEDHETIPDDALSAFGDRFSKAIIELRQVYLKLIENIRHIVLQAFSDIKDLGQLRLELKRRASSLLNRCADSDLKPLLATLANFSGEDRDWLVAVATIVAERPVDSWRESDLQGFADRMRDFAGRFKALETLIARAENALPLDGGSRHARMVTLTKPDGKISSSIVWIDENRTEKAQKTLDKMLKETGADRSDLEAILIALSERLFPEDARADGEEDNG